MKFKTGYERKRGVGVSPVGESLTKQEFKKQCDINTILAKYQKTGQLPDLIKSDPRYGDFSEVGSYQEALDTVILARQQFDALSSKLRSRFGNDPSEFLAFVNDPKNAEEMVSLGLAKRIDTGAGNEEKVLPNGNLGAPVGGQAAGGGGQSSAPGGQSAGK